MLVWYPVITFPGERYTNFQDVSSPQFGASQKFPDSSLPHHAFEVDTPAAFIHLTNFTTFSFQAGLFFWQLWLVVLQRKGRKQASESLITLDFERFWGHWCFLTWRNRSHVKSPYFSCFVSFLFLTTANLKQGSTPKTKNQVQKALSFSSRDDHWSWNEHLLSGCFPPSCVFKTFPLPCPLCKRSSSNLCDSRSPASHVHPQWRQCGPRKVQECSQVIYTYGEIWINYWQTLHYNAQKRKFTKYSPSCHAPHVFCIKRPTFCHWEIPRYSLLLQHQAWACCSGSFDIDGVELASPGPGSPCYNASRRGLPGSHLYKYVSFVYRPPQTRNSKHIYESMTKVQNSSKSSCALPKASLSASSQFFPKCSLLVR